MYTISLVHKYETSLFRGDFSCGTFFEGSITVSGAEMIKIVNEFIKKGTIELHEANNKYLSRNISDTLSKLEFMNPDITKNFGCRKYIQEKHRFGTGFILYEPDGYKYYYWLDVRPVN